MGKCILTNCIITSYTAPQKINLQSLFAKLYFRTTY